MVAEVGVDLHDRGRAMQLALLPGGGVLGDGRLAGVRVDVGPVEELALDPGEEALSVGLAVEVAGPLRATGAFPIAGAPTSVGALVDTGHRHSVRDGTRRDGRNQHEPAIEAQRQPGYRRGTTASGSRTRLAIHVSTSTRRYRTCLPTLRYGGPFRDARQFASVATGMPSRSATSAACSSSITLTRPLTATKSRGTQRDFRTSGPSDRPLQVPLRETCGTSRGHAPSAGTAAGVLNQSSAGPNPVGSAGGMVAPVGTRKPWSGQSSADSDGEPACRRGSVRRRGGGVAIHLRGLPGDVGRAAHPLCGLAPGGVCRAARVAPGAGALLPHRFTLACGREAHRRSVLCGTFLRVAPTGR